MLVHEKPKTINTNTATDGADHRSTEAAELARPAARRVRRPWRMISTLVAIGVVVGIVVIGIVAQLDVDPTTGGGPDVSHQQAENDRFTRLDPNTGRGLDGSFQRAETNRFARVDPNAGSGPDVSHRRAETNRFARLDPNAGSGSDGSFQRAESNRFTRLASASEPNASYQ